MRLEYFEYLMALSEHSSMSAASRSLHVTPQTLSIAIGKLEKELGVKLIVTNNHGTMLNENGLFLVEKTRDFFDAIDALREQEPLNGAEPIQVRVLADEWIKEDFAAQLVSGISRYEPCLDVTLDYCREDILLQTFLTKDYDVALMYNTIVGGKAFYAIDSSLSFVPFWRTDLYCIMHCNHPLAHNKTVSLQALSQTEGKFVVDSAGEDFLKAFQYFAPLPPLDREDNLIALQKKIASNLGFGMDYLGFDGTPVRGLPPECVAVKVSDPIYSMLGYLLRADTLPSPGTRAFLDYLLREIAHVE